MKVTITYHDNDSLTKEEVVRQATQNYGRQAHVEVLPESSAAHDLIYFGIQSIITHEQLSMLYDRGSNYQQDIGRLRKDILTKLSELVDQVIIDNEVRVS